VTVAEIALRAQPLPEVIDLSIILTGSGLGGLAAAVIAAMTGSDMDRIARASLKGTIFGGLATAVIFLAVLLLGVA
jgi:hypothetical protein